MARPLRIQYPNAVYHVTCRGNERKDIFKNDADRKKMLELLARSLKIYGVTLYSYVLMSNHFHLLVETPLGNLAEFMRHFNITYTGYYNQRHRRTGHLYQGRYKSILVEKAVYLSVLSRYIHLNPVRTRTMSKALVKERRACLSRYTWSSLHGYLTNRRKTSFIDYATVLEEYGGDNGGARKQYKDLLCAELAAGTEIKDKIIGRSILGRDEFIEWVKGTYIDKAKSRELPAIKEIRNYRTGEDILKVIKDESGKTLEDLKKEKGPYRQIAMDLLYRLGGMKGEAIGNLFGVGYTSVSQERRRLGDKLKKEKNFIALVSRIETLCE